MRDLDDVAPSDLVPREVFRVHCGHFRRSQRYTTIMVVRVGVRDLRENLRSWLDRVKAGEEVVVTERGKAIAQLTPLGPSRRKLEELIELGIVRPPRRAKRHRIDLSSLPELGPGPTLSDIVIAQRRQSRY